MLQRSFVVQMQDDGTWCQEMPEDNPHIVFVDLDGTASHEIPDLIYTTEDGVVTGISFQDELNGFRYASVFPGYLKMVAITFMASQPGMTVPELDAWEEQLRYNSINNQEFNELSIEYCGVRLYWSCEAENASITSNGSAIASNKT